MFSLHIVKRSCSLLPVKRKMTQEIENSKRISDVDDLRWNIILKVLTPYVCIIHSSCIIQ